MTTPQPHSLLFLHFTFQSGSIQILLSLMLSFNILFFTFQSGSIQMLTNTQIQRQTLSLHSNLVLFKSRKTKTTRLLILL